MRQGQRIVFLVLMLVLVCLAFMFYKTGANLGYVLNSRGIRMATMLVVGVSVAFSSLIFQTITNNKILTPSMMGYEAVFILIQTVIVFLYGDKSFQVISQESNFFLAVGLMLLFSIMIYFMVFGGGRKNMFHLLLLGMVMGTLFTTFGQFLHVLIDPNEFSMIQNFMFVSFAKMNTKLLLIAAVTMGAAILYLLPSLRYLDVIALGKEHAVNLGLDYNKLIRKFLLIIALLVSVSTALVGPITFLGILVANLTYELFQTHKHKYMVWICSGISCLFLMMGQFMIEHIFNFSTTVSIVINFIGGVYFLYLLLRTKRSI